MYDRVFFEPWVGPDYGKATSALKQKVLIVGDSHYCQEMITCQRTCGTRDQTTAQCQSFTEEVIQLYLHPQSLTPAHSKWLKTFTTFINSVYGRNADQEMRRQFCDSVAFYNYLQVAAGEGPGRTGQYDYSCQSHLDAFYEVLGSLLPDMVVCWGDKVWNALPNNWSNNGEAKQGASISCGGRSFDRHLVYPFQHKEITLIGVHHPCVGYDRAYHDQVFATLGILKTSLSH